MNYLNYNVNFLLIYCHVNKSSRYMLRRHWIMQDCNFKHNSKTEIGFWFTGLSGWWFWLTNSQGGNSRFNWNLIYTISVWRVKCLLSKNISSVLMLWLTDCIRAPDLSYANFYNFLQQQILSAVFDFPFQLVYITFVTDALKFVTLLI